MSSWREYVRLGFKEIYSFESIPSQFILACKNGDLDYCKWLYGRVIYQTTKDTGLYLSCQKGNYEVIKWLCDISDFTSPTIAKSIYESCINENLEIAKYIYSAKYIEVTDKNKLFLWLCQQVVTTEVMEWIFSICYYPPSEIYEAMCISLKYDTINTVKWLFLLRIPQNIKNKVFVHSCKEGHVEIAKWFCSQENYPRTVIDKAFIKACLAEEDTVTEWLINIYPDIFQQNLFRMDPQVLFRMGISHESIYFIECVNKKSFLDETYYVDDTVTKSLHCSYNIDILKYLQEHKLLDKIRSTTVPSNFVEIIC